LPSSEGITDSTAAQNSSEITPIRVTGQSSLVNAFQFGRHALVGPHVTGRVFVGGGLTFDSYTGGGGKDVVAKMTDTGDMGYFDESGRLFIVGREDDMIVSGGENVYPSAVENALGEHPDVVDHAVIGVPDEDFGQRLAAFVVPRPGADIDAAELREYLKDKVSRFEQPRNITVVATIPRNPTGKVLRNELPT